MGRYTPKPLTTEEAKERFRAAAEAATPSSWLKRYPIRALALALAGGFVIARVRLPAATGLLLAQKVILPFLVGTTKRK